MKWFYNLKTANKLRLGFGLCLILSICMGVVAMSRMSEMQHNTERIVKGSLERTAILARLNGEARQYRLFEFNHLLVTTPAELDSYDSRLKDQSAKIDATLGEYTKASNQPDDEKNLSDFKGQWAAYMSTHEKAMELIARVRLKSPSPSCKIERAPFSKLLERSNKCWIGMPSAANTMPIFRTACSLKPNPR